MISCFKFLKKSHYFASSQLTSHMILTLRIRAFCIIWVWQVVNSENNCHPITWYKRASGGTKHRVILAKIKKRKNFLAKMSWHTNHGNMEGNVGKFWSPYSSVSLVQGQALIIFPSIIAKQDEYLVIVKTFVIIPMIV